MAILKTPSGKIEVRLKKTGPNLTEGNYYGEYAQLGIREDKKATEVTRYIVPEDTTYGFEVAFKKGYNFGSQYWRACIDIHNVATGVKLYSASSRVEETLGLRCNHVLLRDFTIPIDTSLLYATNGEVRASPMFSFQAVQPGKLAFSVRWGISYWLYGIPPTVFEKKVTLVPYKLRL